jgi:hypothetical protein
MPPSLTGRHQVNGVDSQRALAEAGLPNLTVVCELDWSNSHVDARSRLKCKCSSRDRLGTAQDVESGDCCRCLVEACE